MNESKNKLNRLIFILPYLIFLLLGTFYLFRFTNYILYYQEKSSLFLLTFSYLQEHLNQPGGFLIYLGEFQKALYYYPLFGAFLVMLEICLIIYILQKAGFALTQRRLYLFPFLIGALLFFLQTNYQYQAINNLGILVQLFLFTGVLISQPKFRWIAVIVLPLNYFFFGSFSYLFLGMLSVYFLSERRWVVTLLSWLSIGVFFWIGKEFLFYQTINSLFVFPFSITAIGGQDVLFLLLAMLLIFVPLLVKIRIKAIDSIKIREVKLFEFAPVFILLLLAVVVSQRIDEKSKHYFQAEKLFYEQKYDELIKFNSNEPTNNKITLFLNNVALAETGRLGDSFFKFRQSNDGSTLFLKWQNIGQYLRFGGYYYYAIGVLNEAQRWVYEYTVIYGYTPETLKLLIKTELIKGNYRTAEKYITILEQSLFYRTEAHKFRIFLYNDVAVLGDNELGRKKQLDTKLDFFVKSDEPWLNLLPVLDADSINPVALQYKLSWLMLQKDMNGIVKLLPALESAGLKKIPKNIEEAVVTYKLLRVGEMPDLQQLTINPQTEQRFQRYYQIYQQNQSNKRKAQIALREFADTYWYYVFFN